MLATLALCAFAWPSPPDPPATDRWLLVRGAADQLGTHTYERIRDVYLPGADVRIVGPEDAGSDPDAHRLVVGTPADNALVAELAQAVGIEVRADGLHHAGRTSGPGEGLVWIGDDPDGGGRLALMTGIDGAAAFACFSVSVNVHQPGWLCVVQGRVVASSETAGFGVDAERPRVQRLDELQDFLVERAGGSPAERALDVARGLVGYAEVLQRVGWSDPDQAARDLVTGRAREIDRAREYFAGRDLEAEVRAAYARCVEVLGAPDGPAPAYHVLYGPAEGTNAMNFDPDPITNRVRIGLNLTALARGQQWEAALLHETVHALHPRAGPRLIDLAVHEGVATHLAQVLDPSIGDADALFWSEAELEAAREREEEIRSAFLALAGSADRARWQDLALLGRPLAAVPGAPSRCAYWVGLDLVRAWADAHPGHGPADLLTVSPDEVVAALPR